MTSVILSMQPPHWGRAPQALNTAPGVTMLRGSQAFKRSVADLSCVHERTLHWQMSTAWRSCGKAEGCDGTQRQQQGTGNIKAKPPVQALQGKHGTPINYPTNLLGYKLRCLEVNPRLDQLYCQIAAAKGFAGVSFGRSFQPC